MKSNRDPNPRAAERAFGIDERFVVPASAGLWYPTYKLPPEGGTTNINFNVTDLLAKALNDIHLAQSMSLLCQHHKPITQPVKDLFIMKVFSQI
jgi:hypothetical protein